MSGYTLEKQLADQRQIVLDLQGDIQEIQRLHDEQVQGIEALKGAGSRDFEAIATMEAKKAAMKTMEGEITANLAEAQAEVIRLEQAVRREGQLSRLGELSTQIRESRETAFKHTLALQHALEPLLMPILQADTRWAAAHREFLEVAGQMGVNVYAFSGPEGEAKSQALYAELEARGTDTAPLRWSRGSTEVQGRLMAPPLQRPEAPTAFTQHLEYATSQLVSAAHMALARAKGVEHGGLTSSDLTSLQGQGAGSVMGLPVGGVRQSGQIPEVVQSETPSVTQAITR